MTSEKARQSLVVCLLVGVFFLGVGLRLHGLDEDSMWADEIFTARRVQLDLRSLVTLLASGGDETRSSQAPLMYVVTRFFVVLFGNSDFILRLQGVLFGSFSVLLAYKAGEILWTREVGLLGAFLLAVNPFHVRFSQEARHYGLMTFLALLSLIFLLKALEKNHVQRWVGLVLCTGLGLYNHYFAFLFLPAQVILGVWVIMENWLAYRSRSHQDLGAPPPGRLTRPARLTLLFAASLALIGVLYLPWMPTLWSLVSLQMGSQPVVGSPADLQASLDLLDKVLTSYSGTHSAALLLWLGFLMLGLATCGRKRLVLVLLWVGVPFAFVAVTATTHGMHPKYVLFILPLCLLVIAGGIAAATTFLTSALRIRCHPEERLLLTGAATVALFGVLSMQPLRAYYAQEKTDWRGAAQYLASNMGQGDIVLADGSGYRLPDWGRVTRCLPWYLERYGMDAETIIPVKRGLGQALDEHPRTGEGQAWAAVLHKGSTLAPEARHGIAVVQFKDLSLIRLLESSDDAQRDVLSMLQILLDLLPAQEAHFEVHLALAEIYAGMGEGEEGQYHLELAAHVKPDDPRACGDLAAAYLEHGRLLEAAVQYERMVQLEPGRLGGHWALGLIYEQLGRPEAARRAYETVLRIDPTHQQAQRRLEQLSSP